jgi:RNase P subunit RPR2
MQIPRSTPTCTRFQITIEMPCMTCGNAMRLSLIEPRSRSNFETLTYNCAACGSDERFLMAK